MSAQAVLHAYNNDAWPRHRTLINARNAAELAEQKETPGCLLCGWRGRYASFADARAQWAMHNCKPSLLPPRAPAATDGHPSGRRPSPSSGGSR